MLPALPLFLQLAVLAGPFEHALALGRRGVLPALAQLATLVGRQIPELAEVLANGVLLFRRQALEAIPAIAELAALIGWQVAPALKAILCTSALFGRHGEPALAAASESLLTFGRQ